MATLADTRVKKIMLVDGPHVAHRQAISVAASAATAEVVSRQTAHQTLFMESHSMETSYMERITHPGTL